MVRAPERWLGVGVGAPGRWLGVGVGAPRRRLGVKLRLDRTFHDAGERLMDIVDEDPTWGWIPPSSQFCKKIDGIVVLSGDVM